MKPSEPPVCAGPDLKPGKPSFALPPGATDCHAHVSGRSVRYGYAADRLYTPPSPCARVEARTDLEKVPWKTPADTSR